MLLETNSTVLSLDAPLNALSQEDEVASLGELLVDHSVPGPVEQAEKQELTNILSKAIDHLPEREKLLLALYYQEELTMKEISKILNVSESRVCQLHMQAVMRLRGALSGYRAQDAEETQERYEQNGSSTSSSRRRSSGHSKSRHVVRDEQTCLSDGQDNEHHTNVIARSSQRTKRQIS
jgi:RNA polymerase sigma factor for flagellar operon FliA